MATDLTELRGVGPSTIERLESAGVETLTELAQANQEDLEEAGVGEKKAGRIIDAAKKNSVIVQSGTDVQKEYDSKDTIPTGMSVLDESIGGGWEEGFLVALAGESGTGKTQMAFKAMVSAVEETGKPAVYIETERGRYRTERLRQLASEDDTQEKIYRVKAYDLDQQENAYGAVKDQFEDLSMVVIDSFTARFRLSSDFEGRGQLSQRSTVMGRHLTKLEEVAEKLQVPILITAQVYSNPGGYGASEYVYGGSLFQHTVSFFIYMSQGQGDLVTAEIRNHPGQEDKELAVQIMDEDLKAMED